MTNRFWQAKCGIVWVTSGTGLFNVDVRANCGLLAELPHAMVKDRKHFQTVTEHFQIRKCPKEFPRYIDYLDEGTAIYHMTLKPLRGKQAIKRTTADNLTLDTNKYTAEQCRLYERASNSVDICTNLASWMVLRKDEHFPVLEYVLPLEGSAEMWSHWAHTSNMVEDLYKRPIFDFKGDYRRYDNDGSIMHTAPGSFKRTFKREDCKIRQINIVADLEIPKPDSHPFKVMQFPVEDGTKIQNVINNRSRILISKVIQKFPYGKC